MFDFSWKCMAISVLIIMFSPAFSRDHRENMNEDVKFVRQWKAQQMAKEVAALLRLTDAQVQQLRDIKAACDGVLQSAETQRDILKKNRDEISRRLRQDLEKNGTLNPELERELALIRRDFGKLRQKTKLELQLCTLGLMDVFDRDQIQALRKHFQKAQEHGHIMRPKRDRARTREGHGKRRIARFLLSDAFLSQYP